MHFHLHYCVHFRAHPGCCLLISGTQFFEPISPCASSFRQTPGRRLPVSFVKLGEPIPISPDPDCPASRHGSVVTRVSTTQRLWLYPLHAGLTMAWCGVASFSHKLFLQAEGKQSCAATPSSEVRSVHLVATTTSSM